MSDTYSKLNDYPRGYSDGYAQGKFDERNAKLNADGCVGCRFQEMESWEMPCDRCKRNSIDYWRAKEQKE